MDTISIRNTGAEPVYFPGDSGTVELGAGETTSVRLGVADYAVRNVPAVEFVSDAPGYVKGVSEASTAKAVEPIAEHVSDDPGDTRYAVVGDVPGDGEVKVVPGGAEDHVKVPADPEGETPEGETGDGLLKGAALDDALEAAGLPKTGTADEKRARLAEHTAAQS